MLFDALDDVAQVTCVRRAALERRATHVVTRPGDDGSNLWLVTVTVGGNPFTDSRVRDSLEQLTAERPFVVCARYDRNHAEIRYWDECPDLDAAARQAVVLWADRDIAARLPSWRVIGLDVVDRDTARRQADVGIHPLVQELGEVLPFDAPHRR
jgi:hypothetical protein